LWNGLLLMKKKLQILVFPDCPGRQSVERLIPIIKESSGESVEIEQILIESPEQSARYDFHGSPTFLIDGQDLEESKRGLPPFFGCRLYAGKPAPDLNWILDRLRAE
jgi:hypothetical protein